MLKEVPRVHLNLAHQAAQSTPGAQLLAVNIFVDGLAHVWMNFANEFVEQQFHGNYQRFLYNSVRVQGGSVNRLPKGSSQHETTASE